MKTLISNPETTKNLMQGSLKKFSNKFSEKVWIRNFKDILKNSRSACLRKKVLILFTSSELGGAEKSLTRLALNLQDKINVLLANYGWQRSMDRLL